MKAYVVHNFTTKTMEGIASAAYTFKNEKPTIDEILDATEQIKNNGNYEQVIITSIIPVCDETADVVEKKTQWVIGREKIWFINVLVVTHIYHNSIRIVHGAVQRCIYLVFK